MKIAGHIEEIILCSIRFHRIGPAVHHPQEPAGILFIQIPCPFSVKGNIREAFYQIIHPFRLPAHMENRMGLAECNGFLDEIPYFFILFKCPPVRPPCGIVLAVSVVVAIL